MSDNENQRQLVEVLTSLRSDIAEAVEQGKNEDIQFELGEVEVELKAAIRGGKDSTFGGKLSFKVLGVGAEVGGKETEKTMHEYAHTLRFKLTPKQKNPDTGEFEGVDMTDAD